MSWKDRKMIGIDKDEHRKLSELVAIRIKKKGKYISKKDYLNELITKEYGKVKSCG